mgnify:CR=1 FL=1
MTLILVICICTFLLIATGNGNLMRSLTHENLSTECIKQCSVHFSCCYCEHATLCLAIVRYVLVGIPWFGLWIILTAQRV